MTYQDITTVALVLIALLSPGRATAQERCAEVSVECSTIECGPEDAECYESCMIEERCGDFAFSWIPGWVTYCESSCDEQCAAERDADTDVGPETSCLEECHANCQQVFVLAEAGQVCRNQENTIRRLCAGDLRCCYPCGIPGCDSRCMDVSEEPGNTCPRIP